MADPPLTDQRPLVLSDGFFRRWRGKGRVVLQPPTPEQRAELASIAAGRHVPLDVLLALESLRLLAEQGNTVATYLFEHECKRLGYWYDQRWFGPVAEVKA